MAKYNPLQFFSLALILNGALIGSRWLIRPWGTFSHNSLNLLIAVLLFALFFISAAMITGRGQFSELGQLVDLLLPAVGGVILMIWGRTLPLWNEWLLGIVMMGILVPILLLPVKRDFVLLGILAILLTILWRTIFGEQLHQGWRWLVGGGVALFFLWIWFRQVQNQRVMVYTAVGMIAFLQLSLSALFLPFSAATTLFMIAIIFAGICWQTKSE